MRLIGFPSGGLWIPWAIVVVWLAVAGAWRVFRRFQPHHTLHSAGSGPEQRFTWWRAVLYFLSFQSERRPRDGDQTPPPHDDT